MGEWSPHMLEEDLFNEKYADLEINKEPLDPFDDYELKPSLSAKKSSKLKSDRLADSGHKRS